MIIGIFRALVDANIPVYTRIGFESMENWQAIFDPSDVNTFQAEVFGPLVNFLKKFKINGLLFNFGDLYKVSEIEHYNFLLNCIVLKFEY